LAFNRHVANGEQTQRVVHLAMKAKPSMDFTRCVSQAHALTLRCSVTSWNVLQPQDPELCGVVAAFCPSLKPSNQKIEHLAAPPLAWRPASVQGPIGRAGLEMHHE
jgi:hypothetical protein